MIRLLSIGIDCISSIIFVIPAVLILWYAIFKKRNLNEMIAGLIFAFYLIAVFSVVGIPTVGTFKVNFSFNLIPLIDIVNSPLEYIKNTILNIILFMPLGFLVPAIWKKYRSIKTMFLMGFALSVCIEILQIFTFRLTDIDDLITNTAGTVLGYYICKRVSFQLPFKLADTKEDSIQYEPFIILAVMLLIGVFLKPIVSNGMWDIVLSSSWWENIR
ncbi:MAG: VanZ family protein [Acetatifactor sp.]|nr:VanZ family protein [Acetatifactor sp.]